MLGRGFAHPVCRGTAGRRFRGGRGTSRGVALTRRVPVCRRATSRGRVLGRGRMRRRPLMCSDRRDHDEGNDRHDDHRPPPRYAILPEAEPERGETAQRRNPVPGEWGDEADRRLQVLRAGSGRGLDGVVQRGRVLAPEGVGGRGRGGVKLALRGAGSGGGPDGNQLLWRAQPLARKPDDVLLVASQTATVFGSSIARFHGFADLSSVRVPFRLRGAVQYNSELAPVCLN